LVAGGRRVKQRPPDRRTSRAMTNGRYSASYRNFAMVMSVSTVPSGRRTRLG
jgi:hypothetical protein